VRHTKTVSIHVPEAVEVLGPEVTALDDVHLHLVVPRENRVIRHLLSFRERILSASGRLKGGAWPSTSKKGASPQVVDTRSLR
jgi:hypothetical protein